MEKQEVFVVNFYYGKRKPYKKKIVRIFKSFEDAMIFKLKVLKHKEILLKRKNPCPGLTRKKTRGLRFDDVNSNMFWDWWVDTWRMRNNIRFIEIEIYKLS